MKCRTLFLLACLGVAGLATGCDNLLDPEPRSLITPETSFTNAREAEQAVLGLYDGLFTGRFYSGRFLTHFGDLGTDCCRTAGRIIGRPLHIYTMNPANVGFMAGDWRRYYGDVGSANLAISRISEMDNIEPELQAQLVGEAKFFRAFFYWHMTNLWGDVPMWLEELGKVGPQKVATLPRTPVEEVRRQILDDLRAAEEALPSSYNSSGQGRATRWAAKTLMTKVYLDLEEWGNARDKAQEIISSSPHRLLDDYGAVFDRNNEFNDEVIFSVDFIDNVRSGDMELRFSPRQQDEPDIPNVSFRGYGHVTLFPSFANSYADNDLRKPHNVATEIEGVPLNWIYVPKWWNVEGPRYAGTNFIVFRLADVYLMLAEAENSANGPTAVAYGAINEVRERAGLGPLSGLSQEAFDEAMQQERAWELVGEGHRRRDLARWGGDEFVEAVKTTAEFIPQAAANVQPHHRLFPIPQDVLARNPNLVQNPGY